MGCYKTTLKQVLARKLMTKEELTTKGQLIFETKGWRQRKAAIAIRVANRIKKVKERKIERLAKQEVYGVLLSKKIKSLSFAERRHLRRRAKRIKFANLFKRKKEVAMVNN
ncbi:MAG: hypothetical protein WCW77_00595 [Patescibacteria group bacterium]|jgi:hypothetical protein